MFDVCRHYALCCWGSNHGGIGSMDSSSLHLTFQYFEQVLMTAVLLGDCMFGMTSIPMLDYMCRRWMCHQQIESLQSSFSVGWKSIYQWMNLTSLSESMAHHHRLHGHLRDSHVLEDLLLWVQLVCAVEFIVRSGQVHSFEWYVIREKPYVKNWQSESFHVDEVLKVWGSREVPGVSMRRTSNAIGICQFDSRIDGISNHQQWVEFVYLG